jgi:MFS family permease
MTPLSIANLLFLCVQSILSTAADNIYSNWIPKFLSDVHNLNYKEMGIYSALPLLGGAIGGACGGFLNDWLIRTMGSRRWARSLVGLGSKGFAAILLLFSLLWYEQPYLFCGMLFVVKLFSDAGLATTWGAVTDMGGRATATVFAFNNAVAGVGSVLAPPVYGYVADEYGWLRVFLLGSACYLACALSWLLVNCARPVIGEEEHRK